jgi:hypothetical protein
MKKGRDLPEKPHFSALTSRPRDMSYPKRLEHGGTITQEQALEGRMESGVVGRRGAKREGKKSTPEPISPP